MGKWLVIMGRSVRGTEIQLLVEELQLDSAVAYQTTGSGGRQPVWIPYGAVGDRVRVRLAGRSRGGHDARLLELLEASPERLPARCRHFGRCGGCLWQHVSYASQVALKEQLVERCLSQWIGPHTMRLPLAQAPSQWEYRSRMDYTFAQRGEERRLGMRERGSSWRIEELQECHLTPHWFMEGLAATRAWWASTAVPAYAPHRDTGLLRQLTLREGRESGDRMAILTVSTHYDPDVHASQIEQWVEAMSPLCSSIYLLHHQATAGVPTRFVPQLLRGGATLREIYSWKGRPLVFEISPLAFAQPNRAQAEHIYNLAWELAPIGPEDRVLDLYCGTGALTCFAGLQSRHVLGIESCAEAVEDARRNAAANALEHVRFEVGDVARLLAQQTEAVDLVVVDPPRAGLGTAVEQLLRLAPRRILYISCNPRTQGTDVERLIAQGGYRLTAVAPVDQFPHTNHLENIVVLEKSS